jgi:hypothetical protein
MPASPRSSQDALDQAVKEFMGSAPVAPPKPAQPAAASPRRSAGLEQATAPPEEMDQLRSAYAGVLKHETEKAAAAIERPVPIWRKLLMPVVLLLLMATSAYVWFGHPAFLAPPPHVALKPPATPVTGQRQLVAIALEIDDFRRTTGRLPSDLPELGLNVPHISYKALPDEGYEIRLGTGPHSLYYRGGTNTEPRVQSGDSL